MEGQIKAVRGMKDILPEDSGRWRWMEDTVRAVLLGYGYREIRLPIVEHTGLYARSLGVNTDIVEKEMYTFPDRNGDSLTLRPEGTAGCVRAGLESGLLYHQIQRLWYTGPMFRHERPQQGRYRQFHQVGAEAFGMTGPDIDAEIIALTARLWRALGLGAPRLEINSLGDGPGRAAYRGALRDYFGRYESSLDEDSRRRLDRNPLRILDSKAPGMQPLIAGAPRLAEYRDPGSAEHFRVLRDLLDGAGIAYVINPTLVRGLDYYNRTVFEWITDRLGAQGTLCAGGRYDGLVECFGGAPTPAVGFAMGLERIVALLEAGEDGGGEGACDVFMIAVGEEAVRAALPLGESLRDALPGLRLSMNCGGGGIKAQFRRADKSGARIAVILGADEARQGVASVKLMSQTSAQQSVGQGDLAGHIGRVLGRPLKAEA
ncbi:MAG: histidine--tRNA ligase [Gammaproteobacteria bacterium]